MKLTQEKVRELFAYREDGNLIRIKALPGNSAGAVVGTIGKERYFRTQINGRSYLIHRLIWLWHYGSLPTQIDHINRNPLDNRIENLRPASQSQQRANTDIFKNNTSGFRGVVWHKVNRKWLVSLTIDNKTKHLGYFKDIEDAVMIYNENAAEHFGEYAVLNSVADFSSPRLEDHLEKIDRFLTKKK